MKSVLSPSKTTESMPQWVKNCVKFGVCILPFSADLGATSLVFSLLGIWKQRYRQISAYPLHWGLGLFTFWLIFTTLFAFKPIFALEGIFNFLPSIALLAAFTIFFNNFARLHQLAWWLILTSIPLVFLGVMQLVWGWETPFFFRPLGIQLIAYGNPDGRMSSLLMYANTLAMYLLMTFVLALGLWIDTYQVWRQDSKKRLLLPLGILTIAVVGDGIGLILTNSRSAWGLGLLGLMAFALYLRWYWVLGGVAIAIGAIFWAAWIPWGQDTLRQIVPAYFWTRLTDQLYDDRYVTALRTTQWQVAWEMMLQRPWLGWGLRNFTPVYQIEMNVWMGHPHNLFLMLLAEIGIPGLLILGGVVGYILFGGVKLLILWSKDSYSLHKSNLLSNDLFYQRRQRQHLLLFTYLVTFSMFVFFNCFDISIFDLRLNLPGWILLSAIAGIVYRYQRRLQLF
ncbi:O-antigen polymerase [Aphanothece sacrum FPU1]|uniref:O-antigen polymerase n=2 Tax=Aphanothece sacrum TaxID=1122 RepID=A0A401IGP3_APHSA|nr:O-antigen ligase family protein [Aphanothece sacrum]GBF80389.1 O-antigen polymerase [Aphanothece sacrum FPU1]GBF84904.1 hypothetical protein AsFPU3_1959 [Aphanothece sacrum FPU3]